jgi:hypothetical protein
VTSPADQADLTPFQRQVLAQLASITTTLGQHGTSLRSLQTKADLLMGAQDDLIAAAAAIQAQNAAMAGVATALGAAVANLQAGETAIKAEIAALSGQGVDTSGLNAAVAQINTQPLADAATALAAEVQNVDNIAPAGP